MDKLALLDQLSKLEALRSSLHSSFRFWEWMVVVGLGFDLLVIWKEYWDDLKDFWRREIHPPEKPSGFLLLLALLGTGLILYGISKELSVDSKLEKVETDTREANSKLFGIVTDEVSAVDVKTDKIAEGVNAANQLLDIVGPRSVTLERNKDAFIQALKPFAPQRIFIVSCGNDNVGDGNKEPSDLGGKLVALLGPKGAGWKVESKDSTRDDCPVRILSNPPGVGGIVLVLSTTQDLKAKHPATVAAQKLTNTLNNIRITTSIAWESRVTSEVMFPPESGSFWASVDEHPEAIFLLVGDNPL